MVGEFYGIRGSLQFQVFNIISPYYIFMHSFQRGICFYLSCVCCSGMFLTPNYTSKVCKIKRFGVVCFKVLTAFYRKYVTVTNCTYLFDNYMICASFFCFLALVTAMNPVHPPLFTVQNVYWWE